MIFNAVFACPSCGNLTHYQQIYGIDTQTTACQKCHGKITVTQQKIAGYSCLIIGGDYQNDSSKLPFVESEN